MSISYLEIPQRLKFFRTLRGMTQEDLSCASGIHFGQIRKYESGERVPKLQQLQLLAKGLGISLNTLMDFDIKTTGDVMSLLIKIDETAGLTFSGKKLKDGSYDPDSVTITINNKRVQEILAEYMTFRDKTKTESSILLIHEDLDSPLQIERMNFMLDDQHL